MAKKMATKTAKKAPKKAAKRPAPKPAGAADAIHRLDAEFMKAANARNAGALVKAFYAPDAVLMPPNHAAVEGRAKIQGFLQGLIDSGLTSIKLETTSVASAGDLAYGRGRYTLALSPPGRRAGRGRGQVHRGVPPPAQRGVASRERHLQQRPSRPVALPGAGRPQTGGAPGIPCRAALPPAHSPTRRARLASSAPRSFDHGRRPGCPS